jgi:hypothetical protein
LAALISKIKIAIIVLSLKGILMSQTPVGQSTSDDYFDISKFEELLNRLEGSKGRQQRQKSLESRRDIFAQGLAGMMGNF